MTILLFIGGLALVAGLIWLVVHFCRNAMRAGGE